jgi:nitrogen regulatory protein PII-like uncharacterized protein
VPGWRRIQNSVNTLTLENVAGFYQQLEHFSNYDMQFHNAKSHAATAQFKGDRHRKRRTGFFNYKYDGVPPSAARNTAGPYNFIFAH